MSNDIMKQDNIKETRIIHSLITFRTLVAVMAVAIYSDRKSVV